MRRSARLGVPAGLALALVGCSGLGTFTTTTDTVDSDGGIVTTDDGTVSVHFPPDLFEQAAKVTLDGLDSDEMDDLEERVGLDLEPRLVTTPVRLDVDVELDGPVELEVDLPADGAAVGGSPVIIGMDGDGEVVVPEDQQVTIRQGQPVITADVVEPGIYMVFGGAGVVSLDPLYVTAVVGERFVTRATLSLDASIAGDDRITFDYEVTPLESGVAKFRVPDGGGLFFPRGTMTDGESVARDFEFECVRAGRGTFGARYTTSGDELSWQLRAALGGGQDWGVVDADNASLVQELEEASDRYQLPWRTGVVDCVEKSDLSVLDDLQQIVVGGGAVGTPADPESEPDVSLGTDPRLVGGIRLVTFSPRGVITHVGRTFTVEVLFGLAAGDVGPVTARVTPVSGDASVEPAPQPTDVSLDAASPSGGMPAAFTCRDVGSATIGVEVATTAGEEDAAAAGEDGRFLLGVVKCLEAPGPGEPTWITYPGDLPPPTVDLLVEGDPMEVLPGTLQGPCEGQATIEGHGTIDPSVSGGVYRVPREGSAQYRGSIEAPEGEERTHNGSVVLHTPAGFPPVTIATWSGTGVETSASGAQSWSLDPLWTPAGAKLPVTGVHNDTAGTCTATVVVEFDGGFTDSPLGPISLGVTLLGLGGMAVGGGSLFPRKP